MSTVKKKTNNNRLLEFRQLDKNQESVNLKSNNLKFYIVLFGIIVLTIILYSKSIHNDFLNWDDENYVKNNPDLMDLSLPGLKNLFSRFYVNCYLPLTMLTYALEYKFFGLNPAAYHLDNLILHLLNTILVYIFVKTLLTDNSTVIEHSALSTQHSALICSLLFAIHPMHVESVAWVAERKDLLYTFFYLASLIYYLKYIHKSSDDSKNSTFNIQHLKLYCFSLFLFLLSLLSKSMAVTLPVVLILVDYFKGRFEINSKFKIQNLKLPEKLPFFILSLVFGVVALISQKANNDIDYNLVNINIIDRFFMLTYSISFYIVKLIIPFNLSAIHPYPIKINGFLPVLYYLSPLLIIAITYLLFMLFKRTNSLFRTIVFGILFYITTISVVLMIIPVGHAIVAERYTYLPYLGFFIIAGIIFNNIKSLIFKAGFIFYILCFSFITYSRCEVWKDGISLFTDVIDKYPDVSLAYINRGCTKINNGDNNDAISDFNKAIAISPDYGRAYYNRGCAKINTKDFNGALEDFNKTIQLTPDYDMAYINRGWVKTNTKDYKGAIVDYNKAIELSPDNATAYSNRGSLKIMTSDFKRAIEDLNKAISLSPGHVADYNNRAWAKTNTGDYNGAIDDYDKAIALNPALESTYVNRGWVKGKIKDFNGALQDFNEALSLNSNDVKAFIYRGNAYLSLNNSESACKDWNSALKLGSQEAKNKLEKYCK